MSCEIEGCERRAASGGLCAGHRKRKQKYPDDGRRQHEPLRPAQGGGAEPIAPIARLVEAALRYADAESDEDFDRARANLKDAAVWVALGIPKEVRLHGFAYALISELRARAKAGPGAADVSKILPFPRPSSLRPSLLASCA